MQQRFLPLFRQLLTAQNAPPPTGFWLVHSDEPLMISWLIDACRPLWRAGGQTIKRIELISPKSWAEVVAELDSLSLFDDGRAIIVSGNHKPKADKDSPTDIMAALHRIAQDTPHHLIWCLPKQDKKSLNSKAIELFDTHGLIIDANIYDERMRHDVLKVQAEQLGILLTADAWQHLLAHTENNLLTAHQNLWRLSLLHPNSPQPIDTPTLNACLVDGVEFSVFDLSEQLLLGNAAKALHIVQHLQDTDTAPSIVLWALNKDARLILQLQAGKQPDELGIWRNKIQLYTQAARRTYGNTADWLGQIYEIDCAIKGVIDADAWLKIRQLCLSMCRVSP